MNSHIPVTILWDCLVGNSTLPKLPFSGKDGVTVEKLPSSPGKFTVYFISLISLLKTIPAHSFLGRRSAVVIENAVNWAQCSNWSDKQHVSHRWNFPPWRGSEPLRSSTVWALMDVLTAVMKRGKTWQSPNLAFELYFLCPHLLSSQPTPNNGDVVPHAAS